MMEAVRTSEMSVDNNFTRQYNPEDSSEHHTRRRENLKSHSESLLRVIIPPCVTPFLLLGSKYSSQHFHPDTINIIELPVK
jgi:hypothetical protein